VGFLTWLPRVTSAPLKIEFEPLDYHLGGCLKLHGLLAEASSILLLVVNYYDLVYTFSILTCYEFHNETPDTCTNLICKSALFKFSNVRAVK